MKIIKQSCEILTPLNENEILKHLEQCARVCYKSEHKITDSSAPDFIKRLISRGHEAAIEHFNITVKFITDRAIANEIVRHRLASYCQESTRYCNYTKEQFGKEITVIEPEYLLGEENFFAHECWEKICEECEHAYFDLLEMGRTPQEARCVLPLSLKAELIMTANIREWRHFLKLRTSNAAHPQMQVLAIMLLNEFMEKIPTLFEDIEADLRLNNK